MANKTYGKSRRIGTLAQYGADVGIFDLSRPIKRGKDKINFLVISKPKPISGKPVITVWASDEKGLILDNVPLNTFKGIEIVEALYELGYNLI